VFVRIRDGVEGHIPTSDIVEPKNEDGSSKALEIGDELKAEIANIDTQDRRLTLSMRIGEAAAAPQKQAPRETKMPKKATEESKGNTIGELIKQKLGNLTIEKKDD
jgi:small subunit ribosomal protein S1